MPTHSATTLAEDSMAEQQELKPTRIAAFALPAAPLLALSLPPLVFLPPYFIQDLGVSLAASSGIFLAARVLDIVIDPMIGGWQDKTEHAFGRRRLWMAGSIVPLCALIWLIFIGFQPGVSAPLLSFAMLAFYAAYSSIMIAHLGWAGELSPTYHGRTRILGAVQIAGAAGQIAILLLPAIVGLMGVGGRGAGVHIMGWFLIATLPLTTIIALAIVPERQTPPQPHLGFKQAIQAIAQNRALRGVLLPDFLIGVSQGVLGALFLFFMQNKLGFRTQAEALLLLYFVGALVGVALWVQVAKRTSKHRAVQIAAIYTAVTMIAIPFLPPQNIWIAAPALFIGGLANGAPVLLLRSMMADVVDEDRVKTGAQRSGLFFGLLLTTTKVGQAFGPLCYGLLALFGFNASRGAENTPGAMLALSVLFAGTPFALNLITAWVLQKYPLDEARQAALREALDKLETRSEV
jgi:glycoside/pentoside/hexuronide:cation symporter, GPH family